MNYHQAMSLLSRTGSTVLTNGERCSLAGLLSAYHNKLSAIERNNAPPRMRVAVWSTQAEHAYRLALELQLTPRQWQRVRAINGFSDLRGVTKGGCSVVVHESVERLADYYPLYMQLREHCRVRGFTITSYEGLLRAYKRFNETNCSESLADLKMLLKIKQVYIDE